MRETPSSVCWVTESTSRFALGLIESVLTNYHQLFREVSLFFPLPNRDLCANLSRPQITLCSQPEHHLFPLLLRRLRALPFPAFPPRHPRCLPLTKHFSSGLETEVNVILGLLIKFIGGETDPIEPQPGWMRVLAMRSHAGTAPLYASFPAHWLTGDRAILESHMYVQDL
jgi:hypothetical protein